MDKRLTDAELEAMRGHTPGPWFEGSTLRDGTCAVIGDIDSVVCEYPERSGETLCADTKLIAAAPSMLAELLERRAMDEAMESVVHQAENAAKVIHNLVNAYITDEHAASWFEYEKDLLNALAKLHPINRSAREE